MCLSLLFLISFSVFASSVGKVYFRHPVSHKAQKNVLPAYLNLKSFFDSEISRNNLVVDRIQDDPLASMKHCRYVQKFESLPVFGGEVIYHLKENSVVDITGEYFQIKDIAAVPSLSMEEAVDIFRSSIQIEGLELGDTQLIIFPVEENHFHLAYKVTLKKEDFFSETGIIDAETGETLFRFSNILFDEPAIGLGICYHGTSMKMATTLYENGFYYLYDEKRIRPYNHYTYDYRTGYIPGDADNTWDSDGIMVNAHVFIGLIYDFYYLFFARKGIDDHNLTTVVNVHNNEYSDNAFWNGESVNFCVRGKNNYQFAAAFDVVGHEYSHGVTEYSSGLVYAFEPGALNESFSDIMGTTAEFYWFPEGTGLYKADWFVGEDASPYYNTSGVRNLADPNSNSQLGNPDYPDPCHLLQQYYVPYDIDNGGVHLNMTIYSHAFYLLAHGGTNKVSGIYVDGVGIEKAAKIFYRAWVYYLTENSQFIDAANALLQSAYSLYGSGSKEYAQTIRAMEAIGWIVN